MPNKLKYAEDYKEEIIRLYTIDKLSITQIAKILNFSRITISKSLDKWGIIKFDNSTFLRKYTLNEYYFDEINTPEKAYILGFIYADGCVTKNDLRIGISRLDEKLLEDFKKEFESNAKITIREEKETIIDNRVIINHEISMLQLNSVYLVNQLNKLGVVQRKTNKIEFPYWMNEDLIPSFIAGYFDGDGSITRMKENGITINIVSNKNFIEQLSEYLTNKGWNNSISYTSRTSVTRTLHMYKKSHIKEFLDWIYKDSTIHLQRKYDRYYSYFYEGKSIIPYKDQK